MYKLFVFIAPESNKLKGSIDNRQLLKSEMKPIHPGDLPNLIPRASVAFPQKASRPADTPGKRRPDLDKFCLAQTDVLRPLKLARSHCAGSVEELTTVRVHCWWKNRVLAMGWTVR